MPPTLQQVVPATIPTTPVIVAPYLCHCEALPNSKEEWEEINPCHCDHTLMVTISLLRDKLQCPRPDLHDPNSAR